MHEEFGVIVTNTFVSVEPTFVDPAHQAESLAFDRATGNVSKRAPSNLTTANAITIFGVIGVIQLNSGPYLVVITKREKIGVLDGDVVWKVTGHKILRILKDPVVTSGQKFEDDKVYRALLDDILGAGYFYFSYNADLTHTLQRKVLLKKGEPLWKRADDRFFWNKYLVESFTELSQSDPDQDLTNFILPVTVGFFEFKSAKINNKDFVYALLSRRSRYRAGTRYNSRGVDDDGNVSNFVETEQLVINVATGESSSYVQTRGSIPLFWRQLVNVKYVPRLMIDQSSKTPESFRKHFMDQIQHYGKQIVINLINTKGYELRLGREFQKQIGILGEPERVKYVHFDFHKECRRMRWDRISVLVDQIEADLKEQGYAFVDKDGKLTKSQVSAVRTNCMDCLDRTNVVQSVLARRALGLQLKDLGILEGDQKVDSTEFEPVFKNIWADNADEVSRQYSGTGALKTDFTRTGKRTKMGALQDGANSLIRYVKNNFLDGARQDSFDLFLGVFKVPYASQSPFVMEPLAPKLFALPLALLISIIMAFATLVIPVESSMRRIVYLALWIAIAVVSYRMIVKDGFDFVSRPKLRAALPKERKSAGSPTKTFESSPSFADIEKEKDL